MPYHRIDTAPDSYKVRHFDRNGIAERWFPTREARTEFIVLELEGKYIGWEDPANDYNLASPYIKGKDVR